MTMCMCLTRRSMAKLRPTGHCIRLPAGEPLNTWYQDWSLRSVSRILRPKHIYQLLLFNRHTIRKEHGYLQTLPSQRSVCSTCSNGDAEKTFMCAHAWVAPQHTIAHNAAERTDRKIKRRADTDSKGCEERTASIKPTTHSGLHSSTCVPIDQRYQPR